MPTSPTDYTNGFDKLKEYQLQTSDRIFGYLAYDLKNDVEHLKSNNHDGLEFPDLCFFQPKKLFLLKGDKLEILYLRMVDDEIESDLEEIQQTQIPGLKDIAVKRLSEHEPAVKIKLRIHKDEYQEKVNTMLAHIHRGDIYEANFCQEFYAEDAGINPLETYLNLNDISTPPFATYLKLNDKFLLSATPERYLKKKGAKIISQPIKGTA